MPVAQKAPSQGTSQAVTEQADVLNIAADNVETIAFELAGKVPAGLVGELISAAASLAQVAGKLRAAPGGENDEQP